MGRIEWDRSFSVNNDDIDNQHKEWIAIYNRIHGVMLTEDSEKVSGITAEALKAMHEYAEIHFAFEEEHMKRLNYPGIIEHRRLHRDFENRIYQYVRQINQGHILLNSSLLKIIRNWLLEHILVEDRKFSNL